MPGRVLLIDSDRRTCEALNRCFARDRLHVIPALTGRVGLVLAHERRPDAVLLEVNLPDIDGWSILRQLALEQPVIMLTARRELPDRLMGLDLGADDYIIKPFEPLEVLARVKAVCRRTHRLQSESLDFPGLSIDALGFTVLRNGMPVTLTSREFTLLLTLARQAHRVVPRRQLREAVWEDDDLDNDHALDVSINRLRKKLFGQEARQYICTVRGIGYRFAP